MKLLQTIFVFITMSTLLTQSSFGQIRFGQMSVNAGLSIAKEKDKLLFVDTYAAWCIPCKKMKKIFADRQVADYFNENFVNIKIDMDGPMGKRTYADYDVIFLPTMMIFDQDGNLKYKTDKLHTAEELIDVAKRANIAGVYLGNNASQIVSNPFNNSKKKTPPPTEIKEDKVVEAEDVSVAEEGEIVYVLGADSKNIPPEILYQEAYFRMQLMDNSHHQTALDYLDTQDQWDTEKNLKFIYDFTESIESPLFDYLVNNKSKFEAVAPKDQIERSINILINQRIEQGYPRPNLDEAKQLYGYLDDQNNEITAYQYYFDRLLSEDRKLEYLDLAKVYLDSVHTTDHYMMYNSTELYTSLENTNKASSKYYLETIKQAIKLKVDEPYYKVALAKVYLALGKEKKAKEAILNAQSILNEKSGDINAEISEILEKLNRS